MPDRKEFLVCVGSAVGDPVSTGQAPRLECVTENYFSYFSTKTYVVSTQKNRLDETVLLSTQNTCLNRLIKNNRTFTLNNSA